MTIIVPIIRLYSQHICSNITPETKDYKTRISHSNFPLRNTLYSLSSSFLHTPFSAGLNNGKDLLSKRTIGSYDFTETLCELVGVHVKGRILVRSSRPWVVGAISLKNDLFYPVHCVTEKDNQGHTSHLEVEHVWLFFLVSNADQWEVKSVAWIVSPRMCHCVVCHVCQSDKSQHKFLALWSSDQTLWPSKQTEQFCSLTSTSRALSLKQGDNQNCAPFAATTQHYTVLFTLFSPLFLIQPKFGE